MPDAPNPTPDQVARYLPMARRIAADKLTRPEGWLPGVRAGIYEDIVAGRHDDEAIVQIALAAIIETTERAAKLADASPCDEPRELIATALRRGDHLK